MTPRLSCSQCGFSSARPRDRRHRLRDLAALLSCDPSRFEREPERATYCLDCYRLTGRPRRPGSRTRPPGKTAPRSSGHPAGPRLQSPACRSRPCGKSASEAVTASRQGRVGKTHSCCFNCMPGTMIDRWKRHTRSQAPGCRIAHAWLPRWLPSGTLVLPLEHHLPHSKDPDVQVDDKAVEDQCACRLVIAPARRQEQHIRPYACIQHSRHRDPPAGPPNSMPAFRPGGLGQLWYGQPGGQVSGESGQFRVGPRRQRLAHPQVELVLGQHARHKSSLKGADHLLAIGMRRPQVTTASCHCCHLISGPWQRRASSSTMHQQRNPPAAESAIIRSADQCDASSQCGGVHSRRSAPSGGPPRPLQSTVVR